MSSASSSSSGTPQWPPQRPSKRSKLRNGTWIIPSTGQRTRRQFSLRATPSNETIDDDQDTFRSLFDQPSAGDRLRAFGHNLRAIAHRFWSWLNTPAGHGVLKCTVAYLLGSLATFLSPVSDFLGTPDGKHVVATITVYFHPHRTAGSMLEAVLISSVAVLYAECVCVLSMALSALFGSALGVRALAHVLVLLVGIGAGLGFVGWVKQKMNNPLVNVASTLASIAIISVVTKEESVHGGEFSTTKIVQVLKMLVMGITIAATVCLLLWRVSARHLLRESMTSASKTLGDMLAMITRGFLNGREDELRSEGFTEISKDYKATYAKLMANLRESKFEYFFLGRERVYELDKVVVKSMETLAQAVGGLRSASNTQFALLKEMPGDVISGQLSPGTSVFSPTLTHAASSIKGPRQRLARLASIDESEETTESQPSIDSALESSTTSKASTFHTPSDIFELFITMLGPSMKSLAHTLAEVLRDTPFGEHPDYQITVNEQFKDSLSEALMLYNSARADALHELYKSIELGRSRTEKIQADIEEVAAACGHFSFTLQAVAEEMQQYLEVVSDLKEATEATRYSWNWLKFWRYFRSKAPPPKTALDNDPETETLLEQPVRPMRKSALPKGMPDAMENRRDSFSWDAAPQASRFLRSVSQRTLRSLRVLARDDIRFGVKVGIGAMLWAMFAFIPATRPTYQHWRGEWGLLSFMIVCSMTVGASTTTSTSRFLGTVIGASMAYVGWAISQGNGFVLAFLGWLFSFLNYYVIIVFRNAPLGRTTLLAWNVTALYAYSLSQKVDEGDEDEGGTTPMMGEIVYHRIVAVTLGIFWGMVVCRGIWPISGRKRFKQGLSVLYLQLGLIWKRGPLAVLLRSDNTRIYMKAGEQQALQRYAFKLETLRAAAKSEFELRGPFPDEVYSRIMTSTNRILDGFHAMVLVTTKRQQLSDGEKVLLHFTAPERAQLCDRMCHVFQVLASSMMLEYPLTDAIPSVTGIKDRLLGKIHQFRMGHTAGMNGLGLGLSVKEAALPAATNGSGESSSVASHPSSLTTSLPVVEERDYALLYAYTLVTAQVAEELKLVQKEIESLFGLLHEDALLLQ